MVNRYLFFQPQNFEQLELSNYSMVDITIPKSNVHIYEFRCVETDEQLDVEAKAKTLDELTGLLNDNYHDAFQTILSESSQYFCRELYPLLVAFETNLRYAFYVSGALYEKGIISKESFIIETAQKKKKTLEEMEFGEIYQFLIADQNFRTSVLKKYSDNLTKTDLIKMIQEMEESSIWCNIVGEEYKYISGFFLEIKSIRNHVMHNHLITYSDYKSAITIMQRANEELDRIIQNKIISNNNNYLNTVNIFEALSVVAKTAEAAITGLYRAVNSDVSKNLAKALLLLGEYLVADKGETDDDREITLDDDDEKEN